MMKLYSLTLAESVSTPIIVGAAFLVILVGVALVWALVASVTYAIERRRKRILKAWGDERGFVMLDTEDMVSLLRPIHQETSDHTLSLFPWANLFKAAGGFAMNVMEGRLEGLPARVFEYRFMTGSGRTTQEHAFTVVSCEFHAPKSYTGFRRYGWRDPLKKKEDIVTGFAAFDDAFYIYADEWGLLRNEFNEGLASLFVDGRIYDFVVAERQMTATCKGRLKPADLDAYLAAVQAVVAYLITKY